MNLLKANRSRYFEVLTVFSIVKKTVILYSIYILCNFTYLRDNLILETPIINIKI